MTIKQFNASWVQQEDRILLRFNTNRDEEYRFWLTRHITKDLFEKSVRLISMALSQKHSPEVAEIVRGFQRQKIEKKIVASRSFVKSTKYPLGDLPVLVIGLKILEKKAELVVTFRLISRQKVDVPLNINALQSLVCLLEKTQKQGLWALNIDDSLEVSGDQYRGLIDTKNTMH